MRYLFRLNVESGTGGHADATGYRVGGKTGTAEKVVDGQYSTHSLLTSFVGAFPMDAPRYLTLVMLDEPQGTEETSGSATAGVNAAAVTGRLVERIGPMLDVPPKLENQRRFDEAVSASY
jgi:cell division protein FtsI (penicillin-binding protein 3)